MQHRKITSWPKTQLSFVMSLQFSCSVVSDSLWPMDWLQHARLPCPSPTPGAYSYSWPSSQWCHPTTSSSVVPCSSCFQSFPASGSFPMSQLFVSGGQSTGVSASASIFLLYMHLCYICTFVLYASHILSCSQINYDF